MQITKINWNNLEFHYNHDCFHPTNSSTYFISAVNEIISNIEMPNSLIDLCCGIGAVGISCVLLNQVKLKNYYGFDNHSKSIDLCSKNIEMHNLTGGAMEWIAGDTLPVDISGSIVLCNPPFLPNAMASDFSGSNQKFVTSSESGFEILDDCVKSLLGSDCILILKSFKHQAEYIIKKYTDNVKLLYDHTYKVQNDYNVAFTTMRVK